MNFHLLSLPRKCFKTCLPLFHSGLTLVLLLPPSSLCFLIESMLFYTRPPYWSLSIGPPFFPNAAGASSLNISLSFCLKAGSEICEFGSFCVRLLPLLADVLPEIQPGSRAGQCDSPMQTAHEGTSAIVELLWLQVTCSILKGRHLLACF